MAYEDREAEAERIDSMYEDVDDMILAIIIAALATGIPQRVSEAVAQSTVILWDAYDQTTVWNMEAIPSLYGAENVLTPTTLPAIIEASDARFYGMTETAVRRLEEFAADFGSAAARRDALARLAKEKWTLSNEQLADAMETKLSEKGITGFVDAAGRRWKLRTYAEMAARTTAMEAENAGVKDRVISAGRDLVSIEGPLDYPDGCPPSVFSSPYSVTGATLEYQGRPIMSLDQAISYYGVFHPRCRHWLVPVA